MHLLVTGATGFVGGALLRQVAARGDWQLTGTVRIHKSDSCPAGVELFATGDLAPAFDWSRILDRVDVIIHAAARAHVLKEQAVDPLAEFRRVNVASTLNLARQAAAAGVRRFIFISSIGVNGAATSGRPFTEDDEPKPESAYALSKYEAELGLLQIAADTGLEIVIVRPPLVIGAGAPGNFGLLAKILDRGIPLPLAAVRNRRSFISIDNLVGFILLCATHPRAVNQVFVVSDDRDISTVELLQAIGRSLGRPARLFSLPVALLGIGAKLVGQGDLVRKLCGSLQVDSSKARRLLDWRPSVSIDEGIRLAVRASASGGDVCR